MPKQKPDSLVAGLLTAGVFVALSTGKDLLTDGLYGAFLGSVLGSAFCIGLCLAAGHAAYTAYFDFTKKDETPLNRVLWWLGYLLILSGILWAVFLR